MSGLLITRMGRIPTLLFKVGFAVSGNPGNIPECDTSDWVVAHFRF